MESTFLNRFLHVFEVNPFSKSQGSGLVSLLNLRNKIFHVYIDSRKKFKEGYFLVSSLSPLAHNDFCIVSSSSLAPTACSERRRRFWSSDHFSWKAKDH